MDKRYPLGESARDAVVTGTGRPLGELTLENIRSGAVGSEDISVHPDTLRAQAQFAEEAGFAQLAANLRRAAELSRVPNDRLLAVYEALRPYRVTYERMLALADELGTEYGASENARFVREAAEAYQSRGLF